MKLSRPSYVPGILSPPSRALRRPLPPLRARGSGQDAPKIRSPSAQRRALLLSTCAPSFLGLIAPPIQAEPAALLAKSGDFSFSLPSDWVVAYDRSLTTPEGTSFVAGDFKSFVRVAVSRTPASAAPGKLSLSGLGAGTLDPDSVADILLSDVRNAPSTFGLRLGSARKVQQEGSGPGRSLYLYEYEVESCRGEVLERKGGRITCTNREGVEIARQKTAYVAAATATDSQLYLALGSAPLDVQGVTAEGRWGVLGGVLRTFRVPN